MNVLVVEDNKRLRAILQQTLFEDGHTVTASDRGDAGRELLLSMPFDIAVLDVMLPGMDGFTARDSMADVVHGLNLGADDYLTKPFQIQIFTARVRSVGRRGPAVQPTVLTVGDLSLNTSGRTLHRAGIEIPLMRKEFVFLELLMSHPNQLVTRDQLRGAAWPQDAEVSDGNVDFYMHRLRSRLDKEGEVSLIRTVRSMGYRMVVPR
jgi:DNA-binding response OmpR family regulator